MSALTFSPATEKRIAGAVIPYRANTNPTNAAEPTPTYTAEAIPALLSAAIVKHYGSIDEAKYRAVSLGRPIGTVVANGTQQGLVTADRTLAAAHMKINGGPGDTAPHGFDDPLGSLPTRVGGTVGLVNVDWSELPVPDLEDCMYRMLKVDEIRDRHGLRP